jgi:hypothetical protein
MDKTGAQASAMRDFRVFLALLIVSLVGNACADFGMIWHCIARISGASGEGGSSRMLSAFYVGQSIGVMALAPLLSSWIERFSKRRASIALDASYAFFLALILLVHRAGLLGPAALLPFAAVTAALGILHRSNVGFGALKALSQHLQVTGIVAKFSASLFFTNLVGSAIAGLAYRYLGIQGCLLIAIVTFAPMPLIYLRIFKKRDESAVAAPAGASFVVGLREGIAYLAADPALLWTTVATAFVNLASNAFPGIVGIAFQKSYPGRSDLASAAVSMAIFAGFLAFGPLERRARAFSLNTVIPRAVTASSLALVGCVFHPSPAMFAAAFMLHCCGSSLTNIVSGSLRVSRVPPQLVGRVNTAYFALIHIGQICGGLLLVPALDWDLRAGAAMIVAAFATAAAVARLRLPARTVSEALAT